MNSKERAYLKSLAIKEDSIFQVGKNGINDNLVKQLIDALEARELIKITVLETVEETVSNIAKELSEKTNSELVQVIGKKCILFKQKNEKSRINFPK